ncbi:salicylate synthase [Pseudoalteromonas sp. NZS127_1]|uniref:salicylate synthase n=1 Tax=unclassified Pseudoalteromonas TaxID=194690 RepID=UPI0018CD65F7|nr:MULTISPECIES: salicylate synthase [unclassified Pseudoalteromonas]MBG9995592.1 salicylate synthase [Pseudoalteromonas sp. NZS127_1]MBH0075051.1 salicylate synthase [Pseudoalteromonas sp. SWYJ118]
MKTNFSNEGTTQSDEQNLIFARAAALADSGIFKEYLIYEDNGECWFAGGIVRSITVFATHIESNTSAGKTQCQVNSENLCQVLQQELNTWDGEWQACGWSSFEFAYALKSPELLTEEEKAGQEALLFICEPKITVSLGKKPTLIKSKSSELEQKVRLILENAVVRAHVPYKNVEIPDNINYKNAVKKSVANIKNGLLEKVILSRKVPLHFSPDYTATWLQGRSMNTPARSFTMNLAGWKITGFSPEIVLSVDENRKVTTEPLAGTRRLEGNPETDQKIFDELLKDPKETHEHAISVRLSVDEMNEVCEPESVHVPQFMVQKKRGSVQHLASRVCGTLKTEYNAWHAFESLFPAVTASGIQKLAAFSEIRRHEGSSRGLYAGAILKLDHTGVIDAALVLRSVMSKGDQHWLQAGAGIVLDSTPERELTETSEKLASISPWVVEKKS